MPLTFRRPFPRRTWRLVTLIILGAAFVLLTGVLMGGKGAAPAALWPIPAWAPWWNAPLRMLCNALPGLMLAGLVLALTRRAGLAFVVGLAIEALVCLVSALKFKNLGVPLMPADFLMLTQLNGGGAELLAGYLPHNAWPWLGIAGFIIIMVLLACFEPPLIRRRWHVRAPMAAILVAALVSLVIGWTGWKTVYNGNQLGLKPWSPQVTVVDAGLVSSLAMYHLLYASAHPRPDAAAALTLMTSLDGAVKKRENAIGAQAGPKPDIIIILSESLFDPTTLKGYPPNVDFLPNIHRLARHGISGWMHPPTFGGGTIRTGFEVLTGLSLRYFPDIQFPWLQIHQKVIPGIVRLLKSRGYSAIAVHGNNPGFWNRTTAFKELGFDRFVSINDFPADDRINDGHYLSDKSFTDEMLRQLKPDGPPQFIFGISIEAHGPYDQPFGINLKVRNAIPVPASITGAERMHLQNYIYHIRHADAQLGRLVKALKKRKRRTIVLIFGDHLPALVPAFQTAGFRNGKGFFLQSPPFLIYDTGHPNAAPVKRTVAAWMLPGMVLAKAGITHAPYFALTDILGPDLADLTRAPAAPPPQPTARQSQISHGLRNVARLQLEGKLQPLWEKAAAQAAQLAPATTSPAHRQATPHRSRTVQATSVR